MRIRGLGPHVSTTLVIIDAQHANRTWAPCPRPRGHVKHAGHADEDDGMAHNSGLFGVRFAF
jgi:hypothetical protein